MEVATLHATYLSMQSHRLQETAPLSSAAGSAQVALDQRLAFPEQRGDEPLGVPHQRGQDLVAVDARGLGRVPVLVVPEPAEDPEREVLPGAGAVVVEEVVIDGG